MVRMPVDAFLLWERAGEGEMEAALFLPQGRAGEGEMEAAENGRGGVFMRLVFKACVWFFPSWAILSIVGSARGTLFVPDRRRPTRQPSPLDN
jgi:hypothetical protein